MKSKISSKEENLNTPAAPEITDEMDLSIDFWPTIYIVLALPQQQKMLA